MPSAREMSWLYRRRYLRSRDWRRRRWQLVRQLRPFCRVCGHDGIVDLHHLTYDSVGHESAFDVVVLCRRHHRDVHAYLNRRRGTDRRAGTWAAINRLKQRSSWGFWSRLLG